MQALNAGQASQYMDSVRGERARSAVIAIHLTWLRHSSSLSRSERIEPQAPLDMLLLYEAAVATFQDGPAPIPAEGLPPGGRVINRRQAAARLSSVPDEEVQGLASAFAGNVITLSSEAASEQDLAYYVELFLKCVHDKEVLDNIMSGLISRDSDRLSDPNNW